MALSGTRTVPVLAAAAVLLSGCSAWGFVEDLAEPDPVAVTTPAARTPPAPVPQPRVVAEAHLIDDRGPPGPFRADLVLTVHPVAAGLPPLPVSFASDCGITDPAAVRYLAVDVDYRNPSPAASSLSAGVALRATPGTAGRTGAPGLFLESGDPAVRYCQDGDPAPTNDRFAMSAGAGDTVGFRIYVVAPPAPGSAAAELPGDLELAFTGFGNPLYAQAGDDTATRYQVVSMQGGNTCSEDANSICAALG